MVAVLGVLIAAGLTVLAVLGKSKTAVGQNVFVNPAGIIDAYSTPTIVADAHRPNRVVVAYREDRPNFTAAISWSDDGGITFHPTALQLPAGTDRPFFPDVAFGPDGSLYVVYANLVGQGNVPGNLWAARSSDGGRTLSPPVLLATGLTYQPRITVDPTGTVNVMWVQSFRNGQPVLTGDLVQALMVQSTDGGQHWSSPARVNAADGRLVTAANAVVDHGSLVVAYERFGTMQTNLVTGQTSPQPETYDILVTRSLPGGTTFSPPVVVASGVRNTQRFSLFFPEFSPVATGPDGSLYVAWDQGLAKGQDIVVARSTDFGAHWSAPVRANDNPIGDGTTRSLPAVSVAPDGRVDVAMLDRRNDKAGQYAEAFLATSTNGGKSFHDVKLSSSNFDTRIGPSFGGNLAPDLGSHISVFSQTNQVHVAWSDSRLGTETTGRQDILTARVSVPGSGLGQRKWLLVAAGVLVVGAVVALVVGRRRADSDVTD